MPRLLSELSQDRGIAAFVPKLDASEIRTHLEDPSVA